MPFNAVAPKRIPAVGRQRLGVGLGDTGGTPGVTGGVGRGVGVGDVEGTGAVAVAVDVGTVVVGGTAAPKPVGAGLGSVVPDPVAPALGVPTPGGAVDDPVPSLGSSDVPVPPVAPGLPAPVGTVEPEPTSDEGTTEDGDVPSVCPMSIDGVPPARSERTATTENAVPATAKAWSALSTLVGSLGAR